MRLLWIFQWRYCFAQRFTMGIKAQSALSTTLIASMFLSAYQTLATTIRLLMVGICLIIRMPLRAMGFMAIELPRSFAFSFCTSKILSNSDSLQMLWITAKDIATQMVNCKSSCNGAVRQYKSHSASNDTASFRGAEQTITISSLVRLPQPTFIRTSHCNLRPKAIRYRTSHRHSMYTMQVVCNS